LATASAKAGARGMSGPPPDGLPCPSPRSPSWRLPNPRRHSLEKLSPGNPSPGKRRLERLRPGNPRPESHCRGRISRASPSVASARLRPPPRRRCRALRRPARRGWPPRSPGRRHMPRRRASSPRLHAWLRPGGTGGQRRSPGSRRSRGSPRIPRRASRCSRRSAEPPPRWPRRLPLRWLQLRRQRRLPRRRLPLSWPHQPHQPHQPRQLNRMPRASRRRARAGRQRAADGPRCRPGTRSCSATRASETSPAVLALNFKLFMTNGWLPDAMEPGFRRRWNALDPGFHGVGTHSNRGFMTFQLARSARTVMLRVPV
jgi:hypothetical protein